MSTMRRALFPILFVMVGCSGRAPEVPARSAEEALRQGQPQVALRTLGVQPGDLTALKALTERDRVVYIAASLDTGHWGDAEAALPLLDDPRHAGLLRCYLVGRRADIDAAKRCEQALAAGPLGEVEAVARASGHFGLGVAREHDHRWDEAAAAFKAAAAEAPEARNQRMLMDFFERQGWIVEAIATLEAWRTATPGDATITERLLRALERKVRGDLLAKRGPEAQAAARRLMELAPARAGTWRYYLADGLALTGDTAGAERERAAAKASGAPEPKKPDAVRELDPSAIPDTVREVPPAPARPPAPPATPPAPAAPAPPAPVPAAPAAGPAPAGPAAPTAPR
jgi:hypothetical protein